MDYDSAKQNESIPLKFLKPGGEDVKAVEKAGSEEEEGKETWKHVWYNYSQNTTLHGVNKITEDTPFTLRRIIWLLIVCLGIALFLNQMIQSVDYFLQRPVTVNVKINYNKTLTFPAITICNQNDFRTTASADRNMYALMEEYYSSLGQNHTDLGHHGNMTLDVLYDRMSHRKDDMIVSCKWDEQECDAGDFIEILTDYGQCFSFNMVQNNTRPRIVDRTGADRGLKVLVNVEQYEYMLGPNPGAGIKVLIHENREVPSVRDLGHAIPPGSYAYVAIQITKVANLKRPHGECNDSVQLQYFEDYSVPACVLECKARYLNDTCLCRDFYMKGQDIYGNAAPPVCTMDKYQDCAFSALTTGFYEYLSEGVDQCDCPISCHRLLYDPTISYAGISTFDTNRFKRSDKIQGIYERFLKARETFQRVDVFTVEMDTRLISTLNSSILKMNDLLSHIVTNMEEVKAYINETVTELEIRTHFHKRWGMEKVKYIIHNDFVRGWDVLDERTFSLVTVNYLEMTAFIERIIQFFNQTDDAPGKDQLTAYYMSAEQQLYFKKVLCDRAKDNMTLIRDGFVHTKPILTYMASPGRRYDESYVAPSLILVDDKVANYMDTFERRMHTFCDEVDSMRGMLEDWHSEKPINVTAFNKIKSNLERAARSYNYYRYRFLDKIVLKTDEAADKALKKFTDTNSSMVASVKQTLRNLRSFEVFLSNLQEGWRSVMLLNRKGGLYLQGEINKTELSDVIFSDDIIEAQRLLKSTFGQIKVSSVNVDSGLQVTKRDIQKLWRVMLDEQTTRKFYVKINEDVSLAKTNSSVYEALEKTFAYMVANDREWVRKNLNNLDLYMNADFPEKSFAEVKTESDAVFSNFSKMLDLYMIIGGSEEDFFKSLTDLRGHLKTYVEDNRMDSSFFDRNFLSLDVFMKELSYEEIEQQVGYDLTSLWSDIGGSIGLFIGASIISGFEIIDAIIHHIFKDKLCTKKKKTSWQT